ncbi:hypothetical protein POJ06DRAFT_258358 [Lipomyces tetrasporus]|uniref:Uncharacterized protein n=1 Tax=Lipomyces tetrasporus TaxID=54092 RepID=A0AAD7QPK9_9ASCO|nr:uncharacterized protein POJ06DRAFT_258358 [Lipomyces tetrasporus]KAJ8098926.1 hypothetical protein POJ06DRAFT_258358 [Lipomyces tetrasporus]
MAMLLLSQTSMIAFVTFAVSLSLHASGYCRKLKASEILLKECHSTESLLSDALSAKYKVSITTDSLVSSYSYQNSPYVPSVLIGTRTPRQKRMVLFGSALMMVEYAMFGSLPVLGYVNGEISFLTMSVLVVSASFLAVLTLFVITTTLKSSFKEDDAACATLYFNVKDENWVASSDSALFSSSERMEIAIKWTKDVWFQILLAVLVWSCALTNLVSLPLNEWHGHSKVSWPDIIIIVSALSVCSQFFSVAMQVRVIRRTASSLEVQFAHPVNEKDADNAGAVTFDARIVVRKFADDIKQAFAKSRKECPTDAGVYYDFAIAGKDGGLVYGRIRAGAHV